MTLILLMVYIKTQISSSVKKKKKEGLSSFHPLKLLTLLLPLILKPDETSVHARVRLYTDFPAASLLT